MSGKRGLPKASAVRGTSGSAVVRVLEALLGIVVACFCGYNIVSMDVGASVVMLVVWLVGMLFGIVLVYLGISRARDESESSTYDDRHAQGRHRRDRY